MLKILEEKNIRMIFSKDGNEIWFSANDVGEELGVMNIRQLLPNINSKYKKKFNNSDVCKVYNRNFKAELNNRGEIFIKPHAVYNIAFRSNKPEAKLFTEWATEVIEQIRMSGRYIATEKDAQWLGVRLEGKKVRKDFTDEIQQFVYYATQQGSNKPNMYYKHFTDLVRKKLNIPKGVERDELDQGLLFDIQALERIVSIKLPKLINKNMHYKDAYKEIKKLIEII